MAFVDKENVLTNAHHGIHVVGIDDGGDSQVVGNGRQQFVDDKRCLRVEAAVGLVAEQVLRVQHDGTGDGDALLHTTRELGREFLLSSAQVHTLQAFHGTVLTLAIGHRREHVEWEHHVLQHRQRVEEGGTLEDHSHLAAHHHLLRLRHLHKVATVVEHLSAGGLQQSHEVLHEHRLSRSRLSDDQVRLTVLKHGVDIVKDLLVLKRFIEILYFYHFICPCPRNYKLETRN